MHVALDLMLAGEAKQVAGRLRKVLAAAHLALPASAVDSMEQVVGQADRDLHSTFHTEIVPQNTMAISRTGRTAKCLMYNVYIVMRRTQIYLDDRQRRKLDRVAKRTQRTVSDLIREAIDARYAATPREDFLEALRAGAFGVWKERTDLGQTDAYLRRQRRGSRINRLAG